MLLFSFVIFVSFVVLSFCLFVFWVAALLLRQIK